MRYSSSDDCQQHDVEGVSDSDDASDAADKMGAAVNAMVKRFNPRLAGGVQDAGAGRSHCVCFACKAKSTDVEWQQHDRIYNTEKKEYEMQPTGNLCEVDGATWDCYPAYKTEDRRKAKLAEAEFKHEYEATRAGVQAGIAVVLSNPQRVERHHSAGITVRQKAAFVTSGNYKAPVCFCLFAFVN